jgi:hypothetical protein
MTPSKTGPSERVQKLDEVIAAFLEADQSGKAGDRDAWLQRYPELADELRRFFEQHDRLAHLAAPLRAAEPTPTVDDRTSTLAPRAQEHAAPDVPRSFGDYEILEEIARGGMGVVYLARQTKLNRTVALKMILAGGHTGTAELERFRTEAEAIARLQHPHIVQVFEVGEREGLPFLALEFCPGGGLDKKLAGTPLPPQEAAGLVETLARAMHAAHDKGVIHRDLKPANVLLAEYSTPKITDFGLAKKLDEAGRTATGAVMGTPSYMAPEQAGGKTKELGPACDIYALGAILYECLTGRPPFKAATPLDTIMQVVHDEPVPPRQLQSRVPADLETVCLKCLQKEPGKRYATAAELAEELGRFRRGELIRARPVGRLERGWRWCRRNPALAAALAAVLLVFAAGATVSTVLAIRESHARSEADHEADNARTKESAAVAAKKDLQKVNTELTQAQKDLQTSNDQLLTTAAQGLLAPLAVPVRSHLPPPPLSDLEIRPLWALAETAEEKLRLRFVEEAIRDPASAWQLRCRAGFALQAAVGLDARRREGVERLLREGLSGPGLAQEHRVNLALTLASLGDLEPPTTKEVAALLTRAMAISTDRWERQELALGLAAVAARLKPKEAAEAAALLIQAMDKATDIAALGELARGLAAVAAPLEPREAAAVAGELTQIMTKTSGREVRAALRDLAQCLAAVAARLEPKDAAEVCATLAWTRAATTDRVAQEELAQGLAAVAARLKPKQAATQLAEAMVQTTDPYTLASLARGLAEVAGRLKPSEAAAVCAPAAALLAQAMAKTDKPHAVGWLAQSLEAVAGRLEPKAAAEVCAPAAALLAQAIAKTDDPRLPLGLLARLEPKEAAEAAAQLARAMALTTDPRVLGWWAEGLAAVAARLEPEEAAAVCATPTARLVQAMATADTSNGLRVHSGDFARGLAAVAERLEPNEEAAESATELALRAKANVQST